MVELLAVISIATVFLVMGASLMQATGKGESRQAVRNLVTGNFNFARTRAISFGEPVAVVMIPYEEGVDGDRGKAMTVYSVRYDEASGSYEANEQLRRWTKLPGRMIFSKASPVSSGGDNAFDQPAVVAVNIRVEGHKDMRQVTAPAVIFGETGAVEWPGGSGQLELHLGEGSVQGGVAVGSASIEDWTKNEVFVIGRQTGRVRYLRTK
ncbi:MAG: hypothetical protein Q7Q71_01040 [Verrucomicrobiota bacterium JB023]|nr:hypothetical protein [Verrucomicrobiota bacterium JB023]